MTKKKRILFICIHNSVRSQMAEGLVNGLYADRYEARSAGIRPAGVNPYAIKVMSELGIDISGHRSKHVEEFINEDFDYVVTVCDPVNETCPFFPGGRERIHKGFEDPGKVQGTEEQKIAAFRRARDEIGNWVKFRFNQD